jgi:hypothetical protein
VQPITATPGADSADGADSDAVTEPSTPGEEGASRGRLVAAAAAEIGTAIVSAMLFLAVAGRVEVNPTVRVGQVAALATLQLRFAITCLVVVVALAMAGRYLSPPRRDLAVRVGCAALAGLATGLIAAGIRVALRGTPWPLLVGYGDGSWISQWVELVRQGKAIPAHYPPLSIYLFAGYESLTGKSFWPALRDVQLVGTALYGPAAYLAWRLLLRPAWALGIGVLAAVALVNPLKPYPQLTLVVFLPVVVKLLRVVRYSETLGTRQAAVRGAVFGVGLSVLFLLYSGWFVWAALGIVAAYVALVPWRHNPRPALVIAGVATVLFVPLTWIHLRGLFASTGALSDRFFYFDTSTEPTYFAMWRDDAPGNVGVWPPLGELGGVGLFTLLLAAGLATALLLGWRRTVVIGIGACLVSAWFMRMWFAGDSYQTMSVRLYPRTTMLLFYGLVVLVGYAIYLAAGAIGQRLATSSHFGGAPPLALMLCPLLLVLASAGSAMSDRYMPRDENGSTAYYAWIAHNTRLPNGQCPAYAKPVGSGCQYSLTPTPDASTPAPPNPSPSTSPSTGP